MACCTRLIASQFGVTNKTIHTNSWTIPFRCEGNMLQLSWNEIFVPAHSVLEMIVPGTIMYLGIFTLMEA